MQAYPESNVMGDEESDLTLRSPWLPRTGEICKLVNDSVDSWKEKERNQRFRVCLIISLFIFTLYPAKCLSAFVYIPINEETECHNTP